MTTPAPRPLDNFAPAKAPRFALALPAELGEGELFALLALAAEAQAVEVTAPLSLAAALAQTLPERDGPAVVLRVGALAPDVLAGMVQDARAALGDRLDGAVLRASALSGGAGEARWAALEALKADGVVRGTGVHALVGEAPLALARRFPCDRVEVPLCPFDPRPGAEGLFTALQTLGVRGTALVRDPARVVADLTGVAAALGGPLAEPARLPVAAAVAHAAREHPALVAVETASARALRDAREGLRAAPRTWPPHRAWTSPCSTASSQAPPPERRPRRRHMRKTPKRGSGMGAFRLAESDRPSTSRVWAGSMTPSSHSRAVAK